MIGHATKLKFFFQSGHWCQMLVRRHLMFTLVFDAIVVRFVHRSVDVCRAFGKWVLLECSHRMDTECVLNSCEYIVLNKMYRHKVGPVKCPVSRRMTTKCWLFFGLCLALKFRLCVVDDALDWRYVRAAIFRRSKWKAWTLGWCVC